MRCGGLRCAELAAQTPGNQGAGREPAFWVKTASALPVPQTHGRRSGRCRGAGPYGSQSAEEPFTLGAQNPGSWIRPAGAGSKGGEDAGKPLSPLPSPRRGRKPPTLRRTPLYPRAKFQSFQGEEGKEERRVQPPPSCLLLTVNRVRASGKLKSGGVGDIFSAARARRHRAAAQADDVKAGAARRAAPCAARAAREPRGGAAGPRGASVVTEFRWALGDGVRRPMPSPGWGEGGSPWGDGVWAAGAL